MADKIFSIADGLHDELPSITTAKAGRMLITTDTGEMYYEPEDKKRVKINKADQTYTPDSENAQSGKAVSKAVTTEQNRADSTFSNALKGSKSGSAILIDDVSPVIHNIGVKISSNTITDLTAVKVSRCGKNLMPNSYADSSGTSYTGLTFKTNNDGSITVNGSNPDYGAYYWYIPDKTLLLPAGTYTFNSGLTNGNTSTYYVVWKCGDTEIYSYKKPATFTLTEPTLCGSCFCILEGKAIDGLTIYPQIEIGTVATEYEPSARTEYTPTADGTVEGVTSLYPNTILTTDTDGVIIDCEYNRDINKLSGIDVDVPTKTSELINDSNFATQDYVDEEIANFDFIKIVTELPETGLVNRTYFVPKQDPATNDLYDEYMWVDGKWELITTKQIEVDLTEYVKHTDIDQTYSPTSENAQSGKAVAEAINTFFSDNNMELIKEITLTEDVGGIDILTKDEGIELRDTFIYCGFLATKAGSKHISLYKDGGSSYYGYGLDIGTYTESHITNGYPHVFGYFIYPIGETGRVLTLGLEGTVDGNINLATGFSQGLMMHSSTISYTYNTNLPQKIDNLRMFLAEETETNLIKAGSKIWLFGRRVK